MHTRSTRISTLSLHDALPISPVAPEDYPRVVEVWEASVRATHHFVAESDIEMFRPLVFDELPHTDLACVRDGNGMVAGFRSEEHTSELQSPMYLVCRLLLENK